MTEPIIDPAGNPAEVLEAIMRQRGVEITPEAQARLDEAKAYCDELVPATRTGDET